MSRHTIEEVLYKKKPEINNFIQRVKQEDKHDKIVENKLLKSTEENPYTLKVNDCIKICSELKDEVRQKFLEEKRRQQLRENNQELRQLEIQLRTAYVNKSVAAQIYEQECRKKKAAEDEKVLHLKMDQVRLSNDEFAKKVQDEKQAKCLAFRKELLNQIELSNAQQMKKYEELLKDKEDIDENVRKYKEEKLREQQEAILKKRKVKEDMEEWNRQQKEWKAAQKKLLEIESDDKAMEKMIEERQRFKEERLNRQRIREEISSKIGKEKYAIEKANEEYKDFLTELLIDERQAKEELEFREKLEQKWRQKAETAMQLQGDRLEKERRRLAQQQLDEEYLKIEMRCLAEKDKIEQLHTEERKRKQLEHRRALQESLDQKKLQKAQHMKESLAARRIELEETEKAEQLVKEERARMLKEHASGLMGFLGRGVIRESDRQLLSLTPK